MIRIALTQYYPANMLMLGSYVGSTSHVNVRSTLVLLIGPTVDLPLAPTICQPSANVDPALAQRNSI